MKMNHNFSNIAQSYLFSTVAKKVADYTAAHPDKKVIRLGIGDVTLPLPQVAIDAMHAAVDEQSKQETFHGYGPEQGYDFLKESIQAYYAMRDTKLELDEIFVSATFWICSTRTTRFWFRIRYIRYTWTPTLWAAAKSRT